MNAPTTLPPKTHNLPSIVVPTEAEWLADLQRRYPEIDAKLKAFGEAASEYPEVIGLDKADVAEALQDLLGQMSKEAGVWDAWAKTEKAPWRGIVNVTTNFFEKPLDVLGEKETAKRPGSGLIGKLAKTYGDYLEKKKTEAKRKMEEEAEAQRQTAEAARQAKEKAEREAQEAEARAAIERQREEEARAAAERAQREKAEAEQRALAAREEERRLAAERQAKDRAEKEANAAAIRQVKGHMKEAESLHKLAEAEEASSVEIADLEGLVKSGGIIGQVAGPVLRSDLLDTDQREYLESVRTRVHEIHDSITARLNKRQQAQREKERKAQEAEDARLAEERKKARDEEDARLAAAKKDREVHEAAAAAAQADKRKAEQEAREARTAARDEAGSAKGAIKDASKHAADADRADNRADRAETRLDKATDASLSQTRGDLGTVGGLTRRWESNIVDEPALRAACGPLGEYFVTTALEGAITHYMRARQASWAGKERVECPDLPGVVFSHEQDIRYRKA